MLLSLLRSSANEIKGAGSTSAAENSTIVPFRSFSVRVLAFCKVRDPGLGYGAGRCEWVEGAGSVGSVGMSAVKEGAGSVSVPRMGAEGITREGTFNISEGRGKVMLLLGWMPWIIEFDITDSEATI